MTALTYARARLFLGISNVGFWVLVSATLLWKPIDLSLLALALIRVLGSLPFDVLGGFVLPRQYGLLPENETAAQFFGKLMRGAFAHAAIISVFLIFFFALPSFLYRILIFAFFELALTLFQLSFAQTVSPLKTQSDISEEDHQMQPPLLFVKTTDPGFVGGWAGQRLILPEAWRTALPPDALAIQILRRKLTRMSGAWLRGVVGAVGFNCVGVVLSLLYPGLTPTKFVALSTLWSFLGVLVLPSLSRPAVFASDRLALDAGVAPEALKETILALDRRQDNEPERPQHIETIFHPIPSAGTRIRAIESQKELSKIGGWQLLRTALYLSWASGSLLSRAVHCNIGRPELWVYFPGD